MSIGSEPFKKLLERSTYERFEVCTGKMDKSIEVEFLVSEFRRGRVPAKLLPERFRKVSLTAVNRLPGKGPCSSLRLRSMEISSG
jgi:hypothetical protein